MDTQQNKKKPRKPSGERTPEEQHADKDFVAPNLPIVRANTPRPISFAHPNSKDELASATAAYAASTDFPVEAPTAPPLPEELEESERGGSVTTESIPAEAGVVGTKPPEFIWLFEYGLEMESDYLNGPTRLKGQARIYGPAVLKGYLIEGVELPEGEVTVTLVKGSSLEQKVWGILYRIPQHLAEQSEHESTTALDRAHTGHAGHAAHSFSATSIVVEEIYRKRQISCITYILSETEQVLYAPLQPLEHSFGHRLIEIARQQKLPETYVEKIVLLTAQDKVPLRATVPPSLALPRTEQNTEPLPVISDSSFEEVVPAREQVKGRETIQAARSNGWSFALALYLVGLFMATLALSTTQAMGYWNQIFNASFSPLGVPWYILLYGLLGGCISGIITLGRRVSPTLPGYVMLTWFARPFTGMVLAALAYLILVSGLFAISISPEHRYALFSVVGALAGLCEGWLLFRQR